MNCMELHWFWVGTTLRIVALTGFEFSPPVLLRGAKTNSAIWNHPGFRGTTFKSIVDRGFRACAAPVSQRGAPVTETLGRGLLRS